MHGIFPFVWSKPNKNPYTSRLKSFRQKKNHSCKWKMLPFEDSYFLSMEKLGFFKACHVRTYRRVAVCPRPARRIWALLGTLVPEPGWDFEMYKGMVAHFNVWRCCKDRMFALGFWSFCSYSTNKKILKVQWFLRISRYLYIDGWASYIYPISLDESLVVEQSKFYSGFMQHPCVDDTLFISVTYSLIQNSTCAANECSWLMVITMKMLACISKNQDCQQDENNQI